MDEISKLRAVVIEEGNKFGKYKELIEDYEYMKKTEGENIKFYNKQTIESLQLELRLLRERTAGSDKLTDEIGRLKSQNSKIIIELENTKKEVFKLNLIK